MEVLDPPEPFEGHLYKKGWYDWSKRYFRLVGHYLIFYKSKTNHSHSGFIELHSTSELDKDVSQEKYKRPHCFLVKVKQANGSEVTHYFSAEDDESFQKWTAVIAKTISEFHPDRAARVPTPGSTTNASKDISWKNKLLSKVLTPSIAKTMIQSFVSPDAVILLELIARCLKKYYHDKRNIVDRFESTMLQVGVDAAFLINDKVMTKEHLINLRDPIFKLWSDSLDMLELSFYFDADELVKVIQQLSLALETHLLPFLSSQEKRDSVLEFRDYIANKDAILALYTGADWESEREQLHQVLRRTWDRNFASVNK